MWDERKADRTHEVEIEGGYKVVVDDFGAGDKVLLCVNGGPGLPCDYLRAPHAPYADKGYRVLAFDQLGCGRADKPEDTSLWRIERYVEELETVRKTLDLGKVNLLGHSWGGWLGIEYALTYPENLQTLILENTCGDMPHLISELNRLREALGPETVAMMQRHEAEGTLEHPEYQAAVTLLNCRHVCRLDDWPAPIMASLSDWNMGPYGTMQGPNEFLYIGNLKDWQRLDRMHAISCPSLITVGMHDELGPACAMRMQHALPNAELHVFKNSSHMPFYEEPEAYDAVLTAFLAAQA